jgi:hypothetical protein
VQAAGDPVQAAGDPVQAAGDQPQVADQVVVDGHLRVPLPT